MKPTNTPAVVPSGNSASARFSRRTLTRLALASLALPALEITRPQRAQAQALVSSPKFIVYYSPNGKVPEWWVPANHGSGLVFPEVARSLQPFAHRCLSLSGLSNNAALSSPGAAHAMGTASVLTGKSIPTLSGGLLNDISVDQAIARHIGRSSRFQSLQWSSGEPGPCDVGGSPCAYTQSVSWAGPGMPMSPTINPRAAFEQLFVASSDGLTGDAALRRRASLTSVLDFLTETGSGWGQELGAADRARLDEYFTAIRAVEKRLTDTGSVCDAGQPPVDGMPYEERVEVFHDLIVLALSCGQTNVLSFMIEFGLSGRSHPFIGSNGGHHHLSHDTSPNGRENLARLEGWHAEKLASLLGKLQATPGAESDTLLDETIVLAMPSMGFGSTHDHANCAPLLVGGDGRLQTVGQKLTFGGAPLANLHVTLAAAFDAPPPSTQPGALFGDDGNDTLSGVLS